MECVRHGPVEDAAELEHAIIASARCVAPAIPVDAKRPEWVASARRDVWCHFYVHRLNQIYPSAICKE